MLTTSLADLLTVIQPGRQQFGQCGLSAREVVTTGLHRISDTLIVENTNNTEIRRLLAENCISIDKGIKGNKLLQGVYEKVLGDDQNLIAPFFYLYDLRLWADHSMGDEKLQTVAKTLGVLPTEYQQLMEALVAKLDVSVTQLLGKLET